MSKKTPPAGDQTPPAGDQTPPDGQPTVELVQMARDPEWYPAPHTADVHPNEVENFAGDGWVLAQ